jgi:small subunit ribosomal protein S1
VFTVDSVHKGTVLSVNDKGAIVTLTYGVEGFYPARHLFKADGSNAKVDETLDFKVIEFSKDAKRIVVSHARLHEEKKSEERRARRATKESESAEDKKAVRKVKESQEKTTLGDISALSDLKDKMNKK